MKGCHGRVPSQKAPFPRHFKLSQEHSECLIRQFLRLLQHIHEQSRMGGKKGVSAKEKAADKARGAAAQAAKDQEDAEWAAAGMPSTSC